MVHTRSLPAVRALHAKRYSRPSAKHVQRGSAADAYLFVGRGLDDSDSEDSGDESGDDSDDDDHPAPVRAGPVTVVTQTIVQTVPRVTEVVDPGLEGLPTPTTILVPITKVIFQTLPATQVSGSQSASTAVPLSSSPAPSSSSVASNTTPTDSSSSANSVSSASNIPSSSSVTASPTSQPDANSGSLSDSEGYSNKKKSGVPPAAIGVVVAVLVLALLGLAFFFYRRRNIRSRRMTRATWKAAIIAHPDDFASIEKGVEPTVPSGITPFTLQTPGSGTAPEAVSGQGSPTGQKLNASVTRKPPPSLNSLAPPPASYNNPISFGPVLPHSPARTTPVSPAFTTSTNNPDSPALVRVTFIPTLPDELNITPGETLRVLGAFDDGWAMCTNARGEQGMVPLECLDGSGGQFAGTAGSGGGRSSRRASSLYAANRMSARSTK